MLSKINRICEANTYVPLLTEMQGLGMIVGGVACLGVSGVLKVGEYYNGQKEVVLFVSDDAARLGAEIALSSLKQGIKQIAPAAGIALVIYTLSTTLL